MRVRSLERGWFGTRMRLPGDVFEMPESAMKKDGKGHPVLPKWVEAADAASESPKKEAPKPSGVSQHKESQVI